MKYQHIKIPTEGELLKHGADGKLVVPNQPIIPFIEGDGIGIDITPAMKIVVDNAVAKAYSNSRRIIWMEVYLGEKARDLYGDWFPDETLEALKTHLIGIKGPLTTPVGGGFRSLNVALRQKLDLYACVRPVRWFTGVPSPVKEPEKVNMVIFRENSEDIYAGIEWVAGSPEATQVIDFLRDQMNVSPRFSEECGIGVKPVSKEGTQRLVRRALNYAVEHNLPSVTFVHKGNIMKFTEGAFKEWGYQLAVEEFGAVPLDGGPWHTIRSANNSEVIIKDMIADAMLQQILTRPDEYSVIATLNLNGDYISDALAAQVGGIGIAPGANLRDDIAVFEATHGTAPKYAGQDKVNPCSLILSAEMMLRHLGWVEAADLVIAGVEGAIASKKVTYDFHRLMAHAELLSCSQFANEIVKHIKK